FDYRALLTLAEQRGDGQAEVLAEQIEQRGFDCGHGMNGDAQVKRLLATSTGVAVSELGAHRGEDVIAGANRPPQDESPRILERLPDFLAARNLADADVTGIVGENHKVACEEWRMRPAQIEKHAV